MNPNARYRIKKHVPETQGWSEELGFDHEELNGEGLFVGMSHNDLAGIRWRDGLTHYYHPSVLEEIPA